VRLPLVFVSESSRLREIVELYLITTTEDEIMLISQNSSSIFKFVRRVMAKRYSSCGLAARCQTFEIIGIGRVGFAQITAAASHEGTLNPRASTSTTAVQPYENFVSFGPCVRTTDQKQTSEQGPAFAKYICKTTRCEVDPRRFLIACWSVHSLRGSVNKAKIKTGGWARDTEIQPSPRV